MHRMFFLTHSPLNVLFTKNSSDFVVNEIPLYPFSGEGEHLVLHVRKKDLTTWDMVQKISEITGAKVRDIGYAGLKDKDGMTTQYISLHRNFEPKLEGFTHDKIKILDKTYHNNKIRIGHLKGNRFFIRLKKVNPIDAKKLSSALKAIAKEGYPNFFGYQRFGVENKNYQTGREILQGKRRERNRKMSDFYISAYQSYLFNMWLNRRLEICHLINECDAKTVASTLKWSLEDAKAIKQQPQFFKLLPGDVAHHYPAGKPFVCEDLQSEVERFAKKETTITGWIAGNRSMRSEGVAKEIDDALFAEAEPFLGKMDGGRRFAWNFIEDAEGSYKEEEAWFEMHFSLTKGSYATTVLEELLHVDLLSN
ncbi:MAG: tRNA pseudouridine(13) synthase TruD [Sulfurospirillaceae bacterium]|nr:tRNA pseudouridine(13) synthase TruD [Sulfurospirillaceae bacterium]MDD3462976.1 tRNA pseudouridine(13) synthase TruD [Sulfurospirillaceae bacterium]